MEALEAAHFEALQERKELWQAEGAAGGAGRMGQC